MGCRRSTSLQPRERSHAQPFTQCSNPLHHRSRRPTVRQDRSCTILSRYEMDTLQVDDPARLVPTTQSVHCAAFVAENLPEGQVTQSGAPSGELACCTVHTDTRTHAHSLTTGAPFRLSPSLVFCPCGPCPKSGYVAIEGRRCTRVRSITIRTFSLNGVAITTLKIELAFPPPADPEHEPPSE